jgi:hypothetical protein
VAGTGGLAAAQFHGRQPGAQVPDQGFHGLSVGAKFIPARVEERVNDGHLHALPE